MLLFPNVQKRAQEEIDRVVGMKRLPTFDDEPDLPYVAAVLKEVLRWQQVAPFGEHCAALCVPSSCAYQRRTLAIPHRLVEDDVYNGYFIPKDSIVIGNAWYTSFSTGLYLSS
jgi:hypothetical protein